MLIGSTPGGGINEDRVESQDKLEWFGSVLPTIQNAQARMIMPNGDTIYLRRYREGLHMVIVEDGAVKDQYGLVSQFSIGSAEKREKARIERFRP